MSVKHHFNRFNMTKNADSSNPDYSYLISQKTKTVKETYTEFLPFRSKDLMYLSLEIDMQWKKMKTTPNLVNN
jgi:hypothetical protein